MTAHRITVVSTAALREHLPTRSTLSNLPGCEIGDNAPNERRFASMEVTVDLYEPGAPPATSIRILCVPAGSFRRFGSESFGVRDLLRPSTDHLSGAYDFAEALDVTLRETGRHETWRPVRLAVSWIADAERLERLVRGGVVRPAVFFPPGFSYLDMDGVRAKPAEPWWYAGPPDHAAQLFDYEATQRTQERSVHGDAIIPTMLEMIRAREAQPLSHGTTP